MTNCKNCNTEITQNYCPNCGQPAVLKRIDGHYIVHEIVHILHFEKGILYTIRELLLQPGKSIHQFLTENRSRLVKPIFFIIVTSLVYTLVNHFFHVEDGYVKYSDTKESSTVLIFKWIQNHYGYANIIMGVFIAFWLKIFFRSKGFNFFEILILMCFVMGMAMLIYALFAALQGITHVDLMQMAGIVGLLYSSWAIGQFFNQWKLSSYIKSFVAYILGMITFGLAAVLLGMLLDWAMQ
jgi:Protein of unknown function (DUF3667)